MVKQLYPTVNLGQDLGHLQVSLPLAQPSASALAEREVADGGEDDSLEEEYINADKKEVSTVADTRGTKRTSGKQERKSKRLKENDNSFKAFQDDDDDDAAASDDSEEDDDVDAVDSDEEVEGRRSWCVSVHQATNVFFYNLTGNRVTGDGLDILKKENQKSWETRHLRSGEQDQHLDMFAELQKATGLKQEDMKEVLEKKKTPQGQCDVDHCLRRSHLICHGVFLCFMMSHTANTNNSITRRWVKDWCFGCGTRKYTNGK